MSEARDKHIYVNGIDGATGQYLVEPLDLQELAQRIVAVSPRPEPPPAPDESIHLGLPLDVKPEDVSQAGWAVVFHQDESPEVKAALTPLIEHRRKRVANDTILKVLEYRKGEMLPQWLARHGVGIGSIEPHRIPYYLLLIGSPERIPFEFGHFLDVEYCVGRLHFDTPAEYAAYAQSVTSYETEATVPNSREAVFFAPRHPMDPATQMSADLLVTPLIDGLPAQDSEPATKSVLERSSFRVRKLWGKEAKKEALTDILLAKAPSKPPAFLFTASHGIGWPKGHPRQLATQGALLCQDWPPFTALAANHYFAAQDIPAEARIHGLITFHFACYGAGTPAQDQFVHKPGQPPPQIAEAPFFAALPKALLTHPKGGALACIGHVERAWGYSIVTAKAGPQLLPFRNVIGRILEGLPVGFALKDFNDRYAALSTVLTGLLQQKGFGVAIPDAQLAARWTERNDAEGYVILGDPAVRLRSQDLV